MNRNKSALQRKVVAQEKKKYIASIPDVTLDTLLSALCDYCKLVRDDKDRAPHFRNVSKSIHRGLVKFYSQEGRDNVGESHDWLEKCARLMDSAGDVPRECIDPLSGAFRKVFDELDKSILLLNGSMPIKYEMSNMGIAMSLLRAVEAFGEATNMEDCDRTVLKQLVLPYEPMHFELAILWNRVYILIQVAKDTLDACTEPSIEFLSFALDIFLSVDTAMAYIQRNIKDVQLPEGEYLRKVNHATSVRPYGAILATFKVGDEEDPKYKRLEAVEGEKYIEDEEEEDDDEDDEEDDDDGEDEVQEATPPSKNKKRAKVIVDDD